MVFALQRVAGACAFMVLVAGTAASAQDGFRTVSEYVRSQQKLEQAVQKNQAAQAKLAARRSERFGVQAREAERRTTQLRDQQARRETQTRMLDGFQNDRWSKKVTDLTRKHSDSGKPGNPNLGFRGLETTRTTGVTTTDRITKKPQHEIEHLRKNERKVAKDAAKFRKASDQAWKKEVQTRSSEQRTLQKNLDKDFSKAQQGPRKEFRKEAQKLDKKVAKAEKKASKADAALRKRSATHTSKLQRTPVLRNRRR